MLSKYLNGHWFCDIMIIKNKGRLHVDVVCNLKNVYMVCRIDQKQLQNACQEGYI